MTAELSQFEAILRRDRAIILAGLTVVTLAAWAYLAHQYLHMRSAGAADMGTHMAMPQMQSWGGVEFILLWIMWAVMMVGMMVPSVGPLILIFARANRANATPGVIGSATLLLIGYLTVWTGFSGLAAMAQWQLHRAALLSATMVITSPVIGGALFVFAGVFQFTALKRTCLVHCRSPMSFLMKEWQDGRYGTLILGFKHGAYCVGCCWVLMAMLLVAGVMNLLWVAAIAGFVLLEKVTPKGDTLGRIAGVAFVMGGIALVVFG